MGVHVQARDSGMPGHDGSLGVPKYRSPGVMSSLYQVDA